MSHQSVYRHLENCLKVEVQAVIQENKVARAIDVHEEFREQLEFAREIRTAARKWLVVADEINLDPRSTEVQVVYYDLLNCDDKGNPSRERAPLNELLDRVTTAAVQPVHSIIKTVDLRKFALDAINTADTCIDKFAKIAGSYTQDKKNIEDLSVIADRVAERLIAKGWVEADARAFVAGQYTEVSQAVN